MEDEQFVVNSLLCFLNSGKDDYPYETLFDVIHSFYCFEEVKKGKEILCGILNDDVSWRRDPDKKRKEVKDLLELHERVKQSNQTVKFVTDSHKRMPPLGLEKLGSLLANLTEDTSRINDVLPKILDIKTEVINTADTVRQMKADLVDLKTKFMSAVSGINDASKGINDINVFEDLTSLRYSASQSASTRRKLNSTTYASKVSSSQCKVINNGSNASNQSDQRRSAEVLHEAAESGDKERVEATAAGTESGSETETRHDSLQTPRLNEDIGTIPKRSGLTMSTRISPANTNSNGWTLVDRRRMRNDNNRGNKVTGAHRSNTSSFKAAPRLIDVFVGRVDNSVTEEVLKEYIMDTFGISMVLVNNLIIKTSEHKAFKVTLKFSERNKLFDADLWPEDIVVDKFYNRSRRQAPVDNTAAN